MRAALLLLLALSGCSDLGPGMTVICPQPAKLPPAPATIIEVPARAKPARAPGTPAAAVVNDYQQAVAKEADVVTAANATAAYVHAVIRADRAARIALLRLERAGAHPPPATLSEARAAVKALASVLANDPGD